MGAKLRHFLFATWILGRVFSSVVAHTVLRHIKTVDAVNVCIENMQTPMSLQSDIQLHVPQTKILEGRTKDEIRIFD